MKPLVFHCEANVELTAAAKYYQCQRPDLARDFLRASRAAMDAIQAQPERFAFISAPVRRCRINGFPYRLVYEELNECSHVIAVMHESRDPYYWKNRLS